MTSLQKRVDGDQRSMPLHELTASTAAPIATVSTNLMPPEVIARRRLGWLKRRLVFALITFVALIGLGYGLALQATSASHGDLVAAQSTTSELQTRVGSYGDILRIQGNTAQIKSQLSSAMANDLQWSKLFADLALVAPSGLSVSDIAGELKTDSSAAAAQPGTNTGGGQPAIGKLTVSGSARDYRSIAAFVDALQKVKGFGSAEPGALGNANGRATFTITIALTKAALGGRFTPGGK